MHLGHSISSGDRTEIVKYAKRSFWSSFNIFRADFGHISSQLKNVLFQKYCFVFYGSPLWPLEGAMIQSLCVDWRKASRCVWSVNNRTHTLGLIFIFSSACIMTFSLLHVYLQTKSTFLSHFETYSKLTVMKRKIVHLVWPLTKGFCFLCWHQNLGEHIIYDFNKLKETYMSRSKDCMYERSNFRRQKHRTRGKSRHLYS